MKRIISILLLILLITPFAYTQEKLSAEELMQKKLAYAKKQFRPPDWILGSWGDEFLIEFEFQARDVLSVIGEYHTSFDEVYRSYITDSEKSDSLYSFTIDINGYIQTYRFILTSGSTLDYYLITNGENTGALELKKK